MNLATTLFLFIILAVFLVVGIWLLFPKKEEAKASKGIQMHLSDNTAVKIEEKEDAVHLTFEYRSYEDRPADYEMFPELFPEPECDSELNSEFFQKLAVFDTLSKEEKHSVITVLIRNRILTKDNLETLSLARENPEPDTDEHPEINEEPEKDEAVADKPETENNDDNAANGQNPDESAPDDPFEKDFNIKA